MNENLKINKMSFQTLQRKYNNASSQHGIIHNKLRLTGVFSFHKQVYQVMDKEKNYDMAYLKFRSICQYISSMVSKKIKNTLNRR